MSWFPIGHFIFMSWEQIEDDSPMDDVLSDSIPNCDFTVDSWRRAMNEGVTCEPVTSVICCCFLCICPCMLLMILEERPRFIIPDTP